MLSRKASSDGTLSGHRIIMHSGRFNLAGKYQSSVSFNSQYALIDFRQNVAVRDFKEFTYVFFSNSFREATLKSAQNSKTVQLLDTLT